MSGSNGRSQSEPPPERRDADGAAGSGAPGAADEAGAADEPETNETASDAEHGRTSAPAPGVPVDPEEMRRLKEEAARSDNDQ